MVGSLDFCNEFKNAMKYIKTLLLALLFTMVMPLSQAAAGDTTMVYTQEQVNKIVAEEVQKTVKAEVARQVDCELIDLKIDKAANEKLGAILTEQDRLQAEHDSLISHQLTLIAVIFTVLAAIIGILIPWLMNRNIENKLNENTKGLEKSSKDLEKSKKELEEGKKKLEENTKELEENKEKLDAYERQLKSSMEKLEKSESEMKSMESKIVEIRDEVEQWKQAVETSKMEAEEAARQSVFSERLSRVWIEKNLVKQIESVSKIQNDFPEDKYLPALYFTKGLIYQNHNDYIEAYNNYAKSLMLNDSDPTTCINMAVVNIEWQDYQKAIYFASKAIEIDPNDSMYHSTRCDAYLRLGQLEKALEDAKSCMEIAKRKQETNNIQRFENRITEIEEKIRKQKNNNEQQN